MVQEQHVKTIEWTGGALPVGYISNPRTWSAAGLIPRCRKTSRCSTSQARAKGAGGGLPVIITEGKRALTMRVNDVSGVAGFVTPNTRVDVLFTIDDKINTGGAVYPDHHAGHRALAAGQQIQPDKEGKPVSVGGGDLSADARAGGNARPGLAAGKHPAGAAQLDGHHAVKTFGTRVSALMGGADRAAVARAEAPDVNRALPWPRRPSPARRSSKCIEAAPARCRSFSHDPTAIGIP